MINPQELYIKYTTNPCGNNSNIGTPYDLPRLIRFLKHLKYPCIKNVPGIEIIKNTGDRRIGLPYRFLCRLDAEAFVEQQPSVNSGTSHAIRNALDITRACNIEYNKNYQAWDYRTATEYIQHFGGNSLPDCLMTLGPDLVSNTFAESRATGCGDFLCIENPPNGAAGANFFCATDSGSTIKKCKSCNDCDPQNPLDPCCSTDCAEKINKCCGGPITDRNDFSYFVPSSDNYFSGNLPSGFTDIILKHIGILKRKSYGGYCNFTNNSGSNFYACQDDVFLRYFQSVNNYDYDKNEPTDTVADSIERCRTISLVNTSDRINMLKDLIYNGYGIVLMTNVGFPDTRDSTGLSYPDRIWYHTFSIIGYDDTRIQFPECVFLLANSWNSWNTGGSPSWGPIPPGSFLVTASHLFKMTEFNHTPSFKGCRTKTCPTNCSDPEIAKLYTACTEDNNCVPFECSSRQRAFGLLFALSTSDAFSPRKLDYAQFYPIKWSKQNS